MDYREIDTAAEILAAFKRCANAGEETQLFESLAQRDEPPLDAFVEILKNIKLETVLALAIQAFGKITNDDVKARLKGSEDLLVMLCEQAKSGSTDLIRWSAATTIEKIGFDFIAVSRHLTEEPAAIAQRIVQSKQSIDLRIMAGLTNQEVKKIVNQYIGVFDGYLGNFSYRSHSDFYPDYCDFDVDIEQYEGTTRQRFIRILEDSSPCYQAKILHGVLKRFPVEDENKKPDSRTNSLRDELFNLARSLEDIPHSTPMNSDITRAKKEVFISYAWGGESEEFVNKLDNAFQVKGITIIRDKRDLEFKGIIKSFMERIGHGKAIIIIVSEKYLKSVNCMFELVQISKKGQFYDRIFPVILDDSRIYKPVQRIEYIHYWEEQINQLDRAMRTVGSANLQGF